MWQTRFFNRHSTWASCVWKNNHGLDVTLGTPTCSSSI